MSSDRTPADVIAAWSDALPTMAYEMLSDNAVAISVLKALAAAGFRVTPIPDDNTRALAARLRDDAKRNEDVAVCMGKLAAPWLRQATDLRAAAAVLDGQPQDRPARCPTCGSGRPHRLAVYDEHGVEIGRCTDTWPGHVGGSGDTR